VREKETKETKGERKEMEKKGLLKNWHANLIPKNKRKNLKAGGLLNKPRKNFECTLIQNTSFSLFLLSDLFSSFCALLDFPPTT